MELAEPACLRLRRLAGMEERVGAARDAKLEPERAVERLEHALDDLVAAVDDACDAPALVRELLTGRQVDPRDLEEGDVVGSCIDPGLGGLDQPGHDRRPQDRLIRGHRVRKADRVGVRIRRDEAPRVRLRQAGADERVLDDAAGDAAPS